MDKEANREIPDLSPREMVVLGPLVAFMIVVGVYPTPILERMEPGVQAIVEYVDGAARGGPLLEAARIHVDGGAEEIQVTFGPDHSGNED